jgi:two-component system, OmpR family, KDP operon response regulator KdpE
LLQPPAPCHAPASQVLIVDDDPAIVEVMQMILTAEGYSVLTATNGQEALHSITTDGPGLVLLDLNMPVMSGWELIDQLRHSEISIPVVLVTAGQLAREEATRLNVAGHLSKPFDLEDLLAIVDQFVAKETQAC